MATKLSAALVAYVAGWLELEELAGWAATCRAWRAVSAARDEQLWGAAYRRAGYVPRDASGLPGLGTGSWHASCAQQAALAQRWTRFNEDIVPARVLEAAAGASDWRAIAIVRDTLIVASNHALGILVEMCDAVTSARRQTIHGLLGHRGLQLAACDCSQPLGGVLLALVARSVVLGASVAPDRLWLWTAGARWELITEECAGNLRLVGLTPKWLVAATDSQLLVWSLHDDGPRRAPSACRTLLPTRSCNWYLERTMGRVWLCAPPARSPHFDPAPSFLHAYRLPDLVESVRSPLPQPIYSMPWMAVDMGGTRVLLRTVLSLVAWSHATSVGSQVGPHLWTLEDVGVRGDGTVVTLHRDRNLWHLTVHPRGTSPYLFVASESAVVRFALNDRFLLVLEDDGLRCFDFLCPRR